MQTIGKCTAGCEEGRARASGPSIWLSGRAVGPVRTSTSAATHWFAYAAAGTCFVDRPQWMTREPDDFVECAKVHQDRLPEAFQKHIACVGIRASGRRRGHEE